MDRSGSSSEDRPRSSDSKFGESALQNSSNPSLRNATQSTAETSAFDPEDLEKLGALSEEDLKILETTHDVELVSAANVSEGSRLNQRNMDAQNQSQTQNKPQRSEAREIQGLRESRKEKAQDAKWDHLSSRPTGTFDPTDTEDLEALKEALNSKETVPMTEIENDRRPRDPLANTESRRLRVVSPPRHVDENKPVKSILRHPRETFPYDPTPTSEGVAPLKVRKKDGIPPDARWTKISRKLVNPEALEAGKERFEAREDFVIVLRVLSRDEVQGYAEVTQRIRAARQEQEEIEAAERRLARRKRHERFKSERAQRDQPTPLNPTLSKIEKQRIRGGNDIDTDSGDSDIGASDIVRSSGNGQTIANNSSPIGQGSPSLGRSQPQQPLPENNQAKVSLPVNAGNYNELDHHVVPSHRREVIPTQNRGEPSSGSIITTTYKITAEPPPSQRNSIREDSRGRRSSLDSHNRPSRVNDDKARHNTIDDHNRPLIIEPSRPVLYARPASPLRDLYSSGDEDYCVVPASSRNSRPTKRHSATIDNEDKTYFSNEEAGGSGLKLERERGYTRYAGSVIKRNEAVAGDYGDDGYGYTNPRDLVQYDLSRTAKIPTYNDRMHQDLVRDSRPSSISGYNHHVVVREDLTKRPSSISGYNDRIPRSHSRRERGPPPTTRGFDKIPRSNDNGERGPPASTRAFDRILERGTWELPQQVESVQSPASFEPIAALRPGISQIGPVEEQPQVEQVKMPGLEEAQLTIHDMAAKMQATAAKAIAEAARLSEVSHRPEVIMDLGAAAEAHQGVADVDTPPPEKSLPKLTTNSKTATAASSNDFISQMQQILVDLETPGSSAVLPPETVDDEDENEQVEEDKNRREKEDDTKSETSIRSGASSIASITESIFSIATGSSMSSIAGPQSAVERLVSLLLNDSDIKSLCTLFLLKNDDRERFERNLRRLLKELAVGLRQEAASSQQRHAAHFVRLRARNSAHMICSSLSKKTKMVEMREVEVEYISEESESDSSDDEVDDLQGLETFIKTSKAFETLRENLKNFVHHGRVASTLERQKRDVPQVSQVQTTEHQVGNPGKERNEVPDMAVLLAARMEFEGSSSLEPEKVLNNEQKLTDTLRVRSRKGLNKYAFQHDTFGLLGWFATIGRLGALFNMTPSAVLTGKTRIKWKCKCGHTITDDFTELRPGAAARWKGTLSHSADRSNSSKSSTISSLSRRFSSGFSTLQSLVSSQSTKDLESDLPTHELGSIRNPTEHARYRAENPVSPDRQLIYLLICYNEGRYATRLLQLDLSTLQTSSDKALFQVLRRQYHELRARWISYISLRTLESIRFVHFELYPRELVDVRKQDDVPPPEHVEYRYTPAPPDLIPPVGSNYLMHIFQHPDCAEAEPLCLSRFPKKLKERLMCRGGIKPGWGLQFVEGWNAKRIWIVCFVIFGLGSLATGTLWAVFKHSIQDAFAIATYIVAFATVSVGTVQALVVM